MTYKPYSLEWSRKRYLSEAIQKYLDDNEESEVILRDILDVLYDFSSFHRVRADNIQKVIDSLRNLEK